MIENTTYQEYLVMLGDSAQHLVFINKIKLYNGKDERLIGLKNLAKDCNYDIESINSYLNTPFQPAKKNNLSLKIAAGIVLLIGLSIVSLFYFKSDYSKYYIKDIGMPNYMGGSINNLANANSEFVKGNYDKAELLYNQLEQTNTNDTVLFYLSELNMIKKNYENALNYQTQITSSSVYYNDAQYNMAIANLCLGKKEKAQSILLLLKTTNNQRQNDASTIYKAIFE